MAVLAKQIPIAVVGVSALFPGSSDAGGFFRDILAGRDLIGEVPPSYWLAEDYYDPDPAAPDKTYCKRGGFLTPVPFDALEFGVPPALVPSTDSAQILALIVARKVLDDATRGRFASMDRERVSVILGVTSAQELLSGLVSRLQRPVWIKALRESGVPEPEAQAICERIAAHYTPWQEASFPGLLGNVVAGRIANRFDLRGTNCVTDAACASALSALSMAMNELTLGQSDLVIAGGVDTMNDIFMFMCFSKTPALSPSGECRPFDDGADGTLLGEGMAMFALKRLADAERDGDRIYAVLRGMGSASDGRSKSVYAPLPEGQARALRRAYEAAGYGPETVELVEAHGTGTRAGDAAEIEGLRMVFEESGRADGPWCALGSVKSQIGHTKAAAGAAGLFKAVMALHHRVLPPTIKVRRPNAALAGESSPFYVSAEARPWIHEPASPRRASVSSFGFGGSNFHVTLEEYAPREGRGGKLAYRHRAAPTELVLIGAQSGAEIAARCQAMVDERGDLAARAQRSRASFEATAPARLAVVASSVEDLAEKLGHAAARIAAAPETAFVTPAGVAYGVGPAAGRVGFVFPGQGSQYLGMGKDLAMTFDAARAVWDEAAGRAEGPALHDLAFPRPSFEEGAREAASARLTATENAQPAIGMVSLSQLALLAELGVKPACVAGHSFGELTALCAAGAIRAADLPRVARRRGELMRDAAGVPGAMLAVMRPAEEVSALLAEHGEGVVIGNHNGPEQVVLSGEASAVARVEERLAAMGATTRRLPVATAFHSPLVAPASAAFRAWLDGVEIGAPSIEVIGGADAAPYAREARAVRGQLAEQIAQPVLFVLQIEEMYARGVRVFLEVGPGGVLTELVKRILGDRPHHAIALDRKDRHGVTSLHEALGRLAAAGVALDLSTLSRAYAPLDDRPEKKPAMTIEISGTNHGKPYPPAGGAAALPPPNPPRREEPAAPITSPAAPPSAPEARAVAPQAASAESEVHLAWARAFQAAHEKTAEAHAAYQRAMADSHIAFLRAAEASFANVAALLTGQPVVMTAPAPAPIAPPAFAPPPPPFAPPDPGVVHFAPAPIAEPKIAPAAAVAAMPSLHAEAPVAQVAKAPSAPVKIDHAALLLEVVAEKTGYPAEMLKLEMELEGDLGIDSIKRVEILSAMRDRAPDLPSVAPSDLGKLRSLGQIVEHLQGRAGAAPAPPKPSAAPPAPIVAAPAPKGAPATIQRYEVRAAPEAALGLAPAELGAAQRAVITEDGRGVAAALARELDARGVSAAVVREVPADADAVIFLGGLRAIAGVEEALAIHHEAFAAAHAVAARFAERGGFFVTVQDTGGDFGLAGADEARAWIGGVAALARTAAREWPAATVRAIDVDGARGVRSAEELAAAIARELFEGGASLEVGLGADGARITLRAEPATLAASAAPAIGPRSVIVASGGARGVTAASLIALARARRPRLVLLGRTPLEDEPEGCREAADEASLARVLLALAKREGRTPTPIEISAAASRIMASREVRATLAALRAAGSEARYLVTSVTDAEAVSAALAAVRDEWGPITGVIHAAGVLADKSIADKAPVDLARVLDTKVRGLSALLAATREDPLDLLCVFSSVAARTGNAGQSDYAMANATLEAVACAERARRGTSAIVRAIGWGPWEGGMVTPALRAHFAQRGVALIPIDAGAAAFVAEIEGVTPSVVSVIGAGAVESAVGSAPEKPLRLEIHVDDRAHPYLGDHRIGGAAVLPVAMAIEWLARAAQGARAGQPAALRRLEVVRGVRLDHFGRGGDRLAVEARREGDDLALALRARGDALCYRALAGAIGSAPASPASPPLDPWTEAAIYDGRTLFHGPAFQAIRALEGVGRDGAAGTLAGALELGWEDGAAWRTDPAIIDGALQLAVLWSKRVLGAATLPMAVGSFEAHLAGFARGAVRGVVEARQVSGARAVCDVRLHLEDGRPFATLTRVETIVRPDDPAHG